jgi:transketolase
MRLLRGQVPVVLDEKTYRFAIGRARLLLDGADVAVISTGLMTARALEAAHELAATGLRAAVLHVSTLKPFDSDAVASLLARVPRVVTAENHIVTGGLGSAVADCAVANGLPIRLRKVGIPDCFCESGSLPFLAKHYKMTAADIAVAAREVLK